MFGIGKAKKIKLDICLLTQTNIVMDDRLDAGVSHVESPDTAEGWLLYSNQMAIDEKTGRYVQFVSGRHGSPIKIYRSNLDTSVDITEIASETEDQEMVWLDELQNKDGRVLWAGIIAAMLTLTVCIIALIQITGGR
jgi:hypothetical protein